MAYQGINTGSVPNDGTGDTLQDGAVKVNLNFTEIYDTLGDLGVIGNAELSQVSCTGIITATSFVGNLNANSLNQGTIPSGRFPATITANLNGNADTATQFFDSVLIGGVSFNGASAINLPGVNQTGNQDTSGNAATATVATRVSDAAAPASATATGTAGEVRYDSSFIYVCVATNTWVRSALATW